MAGYDGEALLTHSICLGVVLAVKRTPKSFKDLMKTGPMLQHLRERMSRANLPEITHLGPHAFILPQHYELVMRHLEHNGVVFEYEEDKERTYLGQLWGKHIIVSSEWEFEVKAALHTLPRGKEGHVFGLKRASIWIPIPDIVSLPARLLLDIVSLPRAPSSEVQCSKPATISHEKTELRRNMCTALEEFLYYNKEINKVDEKEEEEEEGDPDSWKFEISW